MRLCNLVFPTLLLLACCIPNQSVAGRYFFPKTRLNTAVTKQDSSELIELIEDDTADIAFFLALGNLLRAEAETCHLSANDSYHAVNISTAKDGLLYAMQNNKVDGTASMKRELASSLFKMARDSQQRIPKDARDEKLAREAIKLWEGEPEELANQLDWSPKLMSYAISLGKIQPNKNYLNSAVTKQDSSELIELIKYDTAEIAFFLTLGDALREGAAEQISGVTRYLYSDDLRADYYFINISTAKDGLLYALQNGKINGSESEKRELASSLLKMAEASQKGRTKDSRDEKLAREAIKLWEGEPEELANQLDWSPELMSYAISLGKTQPNKKNYLYAAVTKQDSSELIELIENYTAEIAFFLTLGDALCESTEAMAGERVTYQDNSGPNYVVKEYETIDGITYIRNRTINLSTAKDGLLYAMRNNKVDGTASMKQKLAKSLFDTLRASQKVRNNDPRDEKLAREAIKLWEGEPKELANQLDWSSELMTYAVELGKAQPSTVQRLKLGLDVDWNSVPITNELFEQFEIATSSIRYLYGIETQYNAYFNKESGRWMTDPSDLESFYNNALFKEGKTWNYSETSNTDVKKGIIRLSNEKFATVEGIMAFAKAGKIKWIPRSGVMSILKRGEQIRMFGGYNKKWCYSNNTIYIPEEDGILCAIIMEDKEVLDTILTSYLKENENRLPQIILDYWTNKEVRPNATRQEWIGGILRSAIEKKIIFNPDQALAGAYNLRDTKTLKALLATRKTYPQELAKCAKQNDFAKEQLRKAILNGIALDDYQKDGISSEELSTVFADDPDVLAIIRSAGVENTGVTFDKPFEAHVGGNLQSGNYYLDKSKEPLQGAIRVPKDATVNINLMGNTLDGADVIVAEGGTLALYNGKLFTDANPEKVNSRTKERNEDYRELRNRGTLILDGVTVATNVINDENAVLTLRNGARVGRDNRSGPIEGDPFALAQTMREMNQEAQLEAAFGDMNKAIGNQIAMEIFAEMIKGDPPTGVFNSGEIIIDSAFVNTVFNSGTMKGKSLNGYAFYNNKPGKATVVNVKFEEVKNQLGATFIASGHIKDIYNHGTMRLKKATFVHLGTSSDATLELDESGVGAPGVKVVHRRNGRVVKETTEKAKVEGEMIVEGPLAIAGACFFPETKLTLDGGVIIGHAFDKPTHTYTGEPIILHTKKTELGQILVKEALPGKFNVRLKAGFFPEEVDSDVKGLKNLTVIKE